MRRAPTGERGNAEMATGARDSLEPSGCVSRVAALSALSAI